ncbi:serine hydrolase domain-containing protein [Lysobacter changpingensis]|uniref:serine hydrolase domain-containing protein n=1 Tax=Lysobacter changpingensis TaxID=2792784 RepID=UPI001A8C3A6B|nr:serine hydrolase domain-containing protein [Lysobacter changpingensis]
MKSRSEAARPQRGRHPARDAHRTARPRAWRARFRVLLAAWIAVAPAQAVAADVSHEASMDASRLQRIDAFLERATAPGGYTGAVALVARDGRIAYERAYGHADLGSNRPMRPDAIFRVYSMTKPLTSVAALMLVEEGRLGLDDPVARHLPEFAGMKRFAGGTARSPERVEPTRPITIRHLLTHTAGFATGGNGEAVRLLDEQHPQDAPTLAEFARRVARAPLADDPGTRFRYDGVNTEVLARVIEVASGQRFADLLQQRILAPLGMRDTGFEVAPGQRDRVVDITTRDADGRLALAGSADARTPGERLRAYDSGAGGLYSTARDYFRFAQMLADDGRAGATRLLSRKSVELMMSDQLATFDPPLAGPAAGEGFGLGGYVVTDVARRGRLGSVGQFGWSGAASTYFTIDRSERLVALLLCQHLPDDAPGDLPRLSVPFFNLVYQAVP